MSNKQNKAYQKHPTRILKEILNNRTEHKPSNFNNKNNYCEFKNDCTLRNVCNSCNSYAQCRKIKYIYIASEAQKKYESTLTSSRVSINISEEELKKLDNLVSPLIKQGQSIKLIYKNHKDEITCKKSCLYNYIDAGLLSVKNIDLPRKVR